jgi:hypothetical protein
LTEVANMDGSGTPATSRERLGRVLRALIWLLSACAFGTLLLTVAGRVLFPWPLEWMEGASVQHALRLSRGLPVYAAPSAEFIPFLYPPLAYVPMALAITALGASLPAARAASLVCTAFALLLIGRAATRAAADRSAGLVAAALFALGFGYTGAFLDLARVDACFVLLLVAGVERVRAGKPHAALWWFALSGFAKQHGLLFLLALSCALLIEAPRRHARALAATWCALIAGFVALESASGGWFGRYTLALPARQPLVWPLIASFFGVDLLAYLPVLSLAALLDFGRRWRARELVACDALLVAALVASALGRAHAGGHDNVRLPAFALLCIAGSVPLCRAMLASQRSAGSRILAAAALGLQGAMLWQSPALYAPSVASAERFAALHSALVECAAGGSAAAPDYALLDAPFVHTMALSDVRMGSDRELAGTATAAVLAALRSPDAPGALALGERFPALERTVLAEYRECARMTAPQLATGYRPGAGRARLQIIYARRREAPAR